jgi:2-methylisocitrate lyase-like PEP mutase family enzyme
MTTGARGSSATAAAELRRLHEDPTLLTVVNVWDSVTAKVVAETPGTAALATASHSIAAARGYADGEQIPVEEMLEEVRRIVAATTLPVTADLEAGYGDAAETVRRAIGMGVVGANIEDQMRPLDDAVRVVAGVMEAADREGLRDFVLNARTDAFLRGRGREPGQVLADAIERGRAYLAAGAPVVFVPGAVEEDHVRSLVDAFGPQRLTLIGFPGLPTLERLEELGVARVSYGPSPQWVALGALRGLVKEILRGGTPGEVEQLS